MGVDYMDIYVEITINDKAFGVLTATLLHDGWSTVGVNDFEVESLDNEYIDLVRVIDGLLCAMPEEGLTVFFEDIYDHYHDGGDVKFPVEELLKKYIHAMEQVSVATYRFSTETDSYVMAASKYIPFLKQFAEDVRTFNRKLEGKYHEVLYTNLDVTVKIGQDEWHKIKKGIIGKLLETVYKKYPEVAERINACAL